MDGQLSIFDVDFDDSDVEAKTEEKNFFVRHFSENEDWQSRVREKEDEGFKVIMIAKHPSHLIEVHMKRI